ncbi:MAG: formylglycine-generating enzyme family protein [Dysgonamonadaceae bacterium]|jgi:formylglycine-generating enzyme required for sulfatase activity|nr:formylglycine-generating enzyme family protein [Dysgonamonadaceae bacterium]
MNTQLSLYEKISEMNATIAFPFNFENEKDVTSHVFLPANNSTEHIVMRKISIFLVLLFVGSIACSQDYRQEADKHSAATNQYGIKMVFVQGGTFMMGCTSEQGNDCDIDAKPAHQVTLSDFYIGQYEVTQKQWKDIMGINANPSYFKGDSLPVENISWDELQEFIRKLNVRTNKNFRLPTEAEWEYACRGGVESDPYKYSGSNMAGKVAWYRENSGGQPHPVGLKSPNKLGLYDMCGNVWEWCSDWKGAYSSDSQTNPTGPPSGPRRIVRGGSWNSDAWHMRALYRDSSIPGGHLGFRLVCNSN